MSKAGGWKEVEWFIHLIQSWGVMLAKADVTTSSNILNRCSPSGIVPIVVERSPMLLLTFAFTLLQIFSIGFSIGEYGANRSILTPLNISSVKISSSFEWHGGLSQTKTILFKSCPCWWWTSSICLSQSFAFSDLKLPRLVIGLINLELHIPLMRWRFRPLLFGKITWARSPTRAQPLFFCRRE